jgi:small subunit ribosomal protein S3
MGQKIHPLGLRIGITQDHQSQWFAKSSDYPHLVIEDDFLRKTIFDSISEAGISKIQIRRKLDQINIEINAARPGLIIGREKNGLEKLKIELATKLQKHRTKRNILIGSSKKYEKIKKQSQKLPQISIHVKKLAEPNYEASFIADFLVEQLEKRIPFRRAVRQAIQRSQRAQVKGIKIQISGRLNGAEIARSEWVREGRVPLQTLRADIDYSYRIAKTIYGLLGIKVWIFKGEIL